VWGVWGRLWRCGRAEAFLCSSKFIGSTFNILPQILAMR